MKPVHRAVALAFAAALLAPASPAQGQEQSGSVVLLVDGDGGAFDIAVHPDIITVLYLPGTIKSVIGSDGKRFPAQQLADGIVLRPVRDVPDDARGNLTIDTDMFKVSVMLHIAESADSAVAQVFFKPREEVERFNKAVAKEVARRYAAIKERFDARHRGMDREVMRTTEQAIAERLLRRHGPLKIARRERHDDNVIVHVERGVWVGNELYVFFEIQNRDRKPYRFARLRVVGYNRKIQRAGIVRFQASAYPEQGTIGVIPAGTRGYGVVCVRDADRIAGEPITLTVSEPGGKRSIKVEGIRW
jgi:hypothetical protein